MTTKRTNIARRCWEIYFSIPSRRSNPPFPPLSPQGERGRYIFCDLLLLLRPPPFRFTPRLYPMEAAAYRNVECVVQQLWRNGGAGMEEIMLRLPDAEHQGDTPPQRCGVPPRGVALQLRQV